jgi:hypothetical protein
VIRSVVRFDPAKEAVVIVDDPGTPLVRGQCQRLEILQHDGIADLYMHVLPGMGEQVATAIETALGGGHR